MDGWMERKREKKRGEERRKKGGQLHPETQIRARIKESDSKQKRRPLSRGRRETERWDERGESGMNGYEDTNIVTGMAAHGRSRVSELDALAESWVMGPVAGPVDGCLSRLLVNGTKPEKPPRIFSDHPVYFGIKGEAWYRLSELTEIDCALTTKQLFVRKGHGVTDRWLPTLNRIKARSSRVQGHLSAAHQQGRRPRHNNVPRPFFPPLSQWCVWSCDYNLI